jgi:hypothetical protein
VANIEMRFDPGFPLDVTFDWGGQKSPYGNRPESVRLIRMDSRNVPFFDMTTEEGAIRFGHVMPGRYRIVPPPEDPAGFYPAAVMIDGNNVLGQAVELTAASAATVVYKPDPGRVRGTVEQGEGAKVLLWPQDGEIPDMVISVEAGASGAFEIDNVPPGNYSVLAFDRVEVGVLGAHVDAASVLSVIASAPRIHIEEAGTVSLTLPVNHWQD